MNRKDLQKWPTTCDHVPLELLPCLSDLQLWHGFSSRSDEKSFPHKYKIYARGVYSPKRIVYAHTYDCHFGLGRKTEKSNGHLTHFGRF